MRKLIITIFILFLAFIITLPAHATANILGDGDSIAHGYNGYLNSICPQYGTGGSAYQDGFWPYLVTDLGGLTFYNGGVDGLTAAGVANHLSSELSFYSCSQYYLHVGINDIHHTIAIGGQWTLSYYLSNLDTIRKTVQASGTEVIVNQILPSTFYGSEPYTSTIKLWNAALEEWCRTNSIKLSGLYQEFCTVESGTENVNSSYCCDTLHPNQAGYKYGASLMVYAAIPSQKRVWGAASYPSGPAYVSWKWWVLSGTAAIQNDADKGELYLAQNDSAQGTVECLPSGTKTIYITASARSGSSTPTVYYRTAATTNFYRNDSSISWTSYTEAFSTTDQFIQVKVSNTSETPAVVRYVAMTWSGSADGTEKDIDPPLPFFYRFMTTLEDNL